MSENEMDEIINEFLIESSENIDHMDRDFILWEENPEDKEIISRIFRTIHTVKGTCGFLGFKKLEKVAHTGENLLMKLREGEFKVNQQIISALLKMVDAIRVMLTSIETSRTDGEDEYLSLIHTLSDLAKGGGKPTQEPTKLLGDLLVESGKVESEVVVAAVQIQAEGDPRRLGEILVEEGAITVEDVQDALKQQREQKQKSVSVLDTTLRVEVGLLDGLMNQIGELVLCRNQLLSLASKNVDPLLIQATQKLNRITAEVQAGLMKTRMQPVGSIWSKYPRIVRDLAKDLGKQVRLVMDGKETEMDKSLIEALKDPLTHIVRNSVDHGIESPENRIKMSKNPEGVLSLRAYHESGKVVMEISDDGGGMDPQKLKGKALEKGLITKEQSISMTDTQAFSLIFLPGFSTAEKVTNVSGRGVGMDVVKTNIESISGSIEIKSELGNGTTLKILIPLTLAIVPALIVEQSGQNFALPQGCIIEIIRLERNKQIDSLEIINGSPVYRQRGKLVPLIHIRDALDIKRNTTTSSLKDPDVLTFVIVKNDNRIFGLVIDKVLERQEIVVKPLSRSIKNLKVYSGATILGSGKVALILDISGIGERVQIDKDLSDIRNTGDSIVKNLREKNMSQYLVFKTEDNSRLSVPLGSVLRLETIPLKSIEKIGEWKVIQYRDQVLPLLDIVQGLPTSNSTQDLENSFHAQGKVIVYKSGEKTVGIMIHAIIDIAYGEDEKKYDPTRDYILYNLVLKGKVTEVLDVDSLILAVDTGFFNRKVLKGELVVS